MNGTPTIIQVNDVSKRFVLHKDKSVKERLVNFSRSRQNREDFWALRNINLDIHSGTTIGLVGHNGSGKSTLLKAIGGIIQPTSGTIFRRGRLAALLELGAGFHPDLTGRENVYLNAAILGLNKAETDRHFDEIVDFSGIEEFIDTQVKFYSSGMYVRLAFSVAVHVDPDLLLVDEVLAVGDEPFQRKCMDKIAEFQSEGRTIVLVSHSADQIGSLCDRVAVLDHGRLVHDGDTAEGLHILRAGFEAERLRVDAELEARESATARRPAPRAGITQVTARSSSLTPAGYFGRGSDVTIDIDYRIDSVPEGWMTGFTVLTPLGHAVYRLNTEGLGIRMSTEPGTYRASFHLPRTAFGAGEFLVSAGIVTATGEVIHEVNPATMFAVEDDPFGAGYLQFAASGEITRLDRP